METYEKNIVKLEMEVERLSVIEKEAAELRQRVQGSLLVINLVRHFK